MRSRKSLEAKSQQIGDRAVKLAVGKTASEITARPFPIADPSTLDSKILKDAKLKFKEASSYSEKIQILTVGASAKLNPYQISKEFETTIYLAKMAIDEYKIGGLFSKPVQKTLKRFSADHENAVKSYYINDEVSKMLPGRKDYVTIKLPDGTKHQEQKRLLLFNIRTAHEMFKDKHPHISIGCSKFAELRPKQVVFAGAPGTLIVCVCMIHANPELMWEALSKYAAISSHGLKNCTDCILSTLCNPPSSDCNLGACSLCPGNSTLESALQDILQLHDEGEVRFSQWVMQEGRCNFEVLLKKVDDFIEEFLSSLEKLMPHRYLVKMQHEYFEERKNSLQEGEVLILGDYSENFSFVIQNSIQSQYWKNDQSTIHVFVCIYRGENGDFRHINHVVFSNYMKHETMAIHLFQTKLMAHLNTLLPFPLRKVIYFSDGAASQYKNRFNFCNLMYHEKDFGCQAEWNFHPTSHGKNLCDGVGGTVKRKAYNASLRQDSTCPITTPQKLHDYIKENMPSVYCDFTDVKDHTRHNRSQSKRFKDCPKIEGCRSKHHFIPKSSTVLAAKVFSLSYEEVLYDCFNVS